MIPQNRDTLANTGLSLVQMPRKSTFVPYLFNNQTQRRVDISLRFRRRTELQWAILNLLQMQGTIYTPEGISDPLLTPHSVDPLVE